MESKENIKKKALIADSNSTIQQIIVNILSEKFSLITANDGDEAISKINDNMPDIILVDVKLPKLNGYELSRMIKSKPATEHIPVILLSGAFEPIDKELFNETRAEDYIIKPFDYNSLLNKINTALNKPITKKITQEEKKFTELSKEDTAEQINLMKSLEKILDKDKFAEIIRDPEIKQKIITKTEKEEYSSLKKEIVETIKKGLDQNLEDMFSSVDMPKIFSQAIDSSIQKNLFQITKEAYDIVRKSIENTAKDVFEENISSLKNKIEEVIKKTVSDIAERLIKNEIEQIKSNFM